MKSNDFTTEEVFARDKVWDDNGVSTSVGPESLNSPLSIKSILCKLDPAIAG